MAYETLAFLLAVAFAAGCIDAIAGGGGLLTLPALLAAGLPPVAAVGTNKLQSSIGAAGTVAAFWRKGHVDPRRVAVPAACAFVGSIGGAILLSRVDPAVLAGLMPVLMIGIAAWFLFTPRLGEIERHARLGFAGLAAAVGVVGFYDGFFGPGAGAFYAAVFLSLGGLKLLRATAHTKAVNLSSNIAGLGVLIAGGNVVWIAGLVMAMGSLLGGQVGSRLAMRFGGRVIRPLLVVMSLALTARMVADPVNPVHRWLWG